MAKDHVKLNIVNENDKIFGQSFDDEVEMIFGRPAQAPSKNHVTNNVHLMDADRGLHKHFNGISNNMGERDLERPTQPLLKPSRERQMPPLAGPEIDDLDGDLPKDATPYPGIDDGLLETTDKKPLPHEDHDGSEHHSELEPSDKTSHHDDGATTDGKLPWGHDEADYPYGDWSTIHYNHYYAQCQRAHNEIRRFAASITDAWGDSGREHLPAEEESGAGHDGPGAPVSQRQPAALRAGVRDFAPLLLLQSCVHLAQYYLSNPGRRGPHHEQPIRRQRPQGAL